MTEPSDLEPILREAIAAAEQDETQVLRDIADLAEDTHPSK